MIVPTLPGDAKADVQAWNARGGLAVRRIVSRSRDGDCPNCGGLRVVLVSFLGAGPSHTPVTLNKASAFVDAGWWVVEDTRGYPCPVCFGRPVVRAAPRMLKDTATKAREVAKTLTRTGRGKSAPALLGPQSEGD